MKTIHKYLLGIASIGFLTGCQPLEQVGPQICPPDSFEFAESDLKLMVVDGASEVAIENSGSDLDLGSEGLHITSDFGGDVVAWELIISNGTQEKVYSEESDGIDIYWYGQPGRFENDKMQFDEGEVTVSLTITCMDVITKTFDLTGTQKFNNLNSQFGFLIRDWDQNGSFAIDGPAFSPADGWAGAGGGANPWEFEYYDVDESPAGGAYAQFNGETPAPAWYLGGTSFPVPGIADSLPTENVDSLYLNIFVKADENYPNAGSQIAFQYAGLNYLKLEDINWTGWKLLSYKLGDFSTSSGKKLPGTNVDNFVMQLGAQPEQASKLIVQYDFVLITHGTPLFED